MTKDTRNMTREEVEQLCYTTVNVCTVGTRTGRNSIKVEYHPGMVESYPGSADWHYSDNNKRIAEYKKARPPIKSEDEILNELPCTPEGEIEVEYRQKNLHLRYKMWIPSFRIDKKRLIKDINTYVHKFIGAVLNIPYTKISCYDVAYIGGVLPIGKGRTLENGVADDILHIGIPAYGGVYHTDDHSDTEMKYW